MMEMGSLLLTRPTSRCVCLFVPQGKETQTTLEKKVDVPVVWRRPYNCFFFFPSLDVHPSVVVAAQASYKLSRARTVTHRECVCCVEALRFVIWTDELQKTFGKSSVPSTPPSLYRLAPDVGRIFPQVLISTCVCEWCHSARCEQLVSQQCAVQLVLSLYPSRSSLVLFGLNVVLLELGRQSVFIFKGRWSGKKRGLGQTTSVYSYCFFCFFYYVAPIPHWRK